MSPGSSSRGRRGVASDEASLREVFSYYDRDGSGSVNKGELICILSDLGVLDGLHPADAAAALDAEYLAADGNRDGGIDFDELRSFMTAFARVPPRASPPREIPPDFHAPGNLGASVRDAFLRHCTKKHPEEMNSAHFLRVARKSGFVDDALSLSVAAIVFAKAHRPKTKRVAYDEFVAALASVAALRDVPFLTVASDFARRSVAAPRKERADRSPPRGPIEAGDPPEGIDPSVAGRGARGTGAGIRDAAGSRDASSDDDRSLEIYRLRAENERLKASMDELRRRRRADADADADAYAFGRDEVSDEVSDEDARRIARELEEIDRRRAALARKDEARAAAVAALAAATEKMDAEAAAAAAERRARDDRRAEAARLARLARAKVVGSVGSGATSPNPGAESAAAPNTTSATTPSRPGSSTATPPPAKKKRWKGYASALDAEDAAELVRRRAATNGVDRVSLKGCRLADADAVRSVCDTLRTLRDDAKPDDGDGGDENCGKRSGKTGPSSTYYPTTTLNLSSADVCGEGASALASFLLDPLCALEELNLVDNPRMGVHLVETRAAAHATARRADDPVVDGGGCAALAIALRSSGCSLRRLNLGGCGVTDAGASALAAAIATPGACPHLETLNLRSNDVGLAGASDLASAAARHGGALGDVSLANNARCSADARFELDDVLARNRRASLAGEMRRAAGGRVDFKRRGLSDADAAAIAAALAPGARGDGVVGLDASDNKFTAVGVEALASALRGARGNRSLAHVTVRGNPGATYDRANDRAGLPTVAAQSLAGACAANFLAATGEGEALKSVADRGLGDAGAAEIAAAFAERFESFRRLRAVGTQHNGIGPAGAEALARAFGSLPRLDEWAAYSNRVGPAGAVAIARRMRVPGAFTKLRVLDLGGNGVGDAGCVAIAEAIVDHPAMEELHLDHNDVGEEGALALAGAMEATATGFFGFRLGGGDGGEEDADASIPSSSSSGSWWWRGRGGARGRRAHVNPNPTPRGRAPRPNPNANADPRAKAPGLSRVWLHGNPRVPDDALAKIHALASANAGDASRDVEMIPSASVEDVWRAERDDAETAEAEARASYAKTSAGRVPGVFSSAYFADRVAARAAAAYRRVLPNHARDVRGAAVVAAILAHEKAGDGARDGPGAGDDLKVLAIGVGTKFVPPAVAAAAAAAGPAREGTFVRDSHAEVLARRGFRRYLLREMRELAAEAAGPDVVRAGPKHVREVDGNGSGASSLGANGGSLGGHASRASVGGDHPPRDARASRPPWRFLELVGAGGGFRARAGVTLHLYVSTAPCGGASASSASAGVETAAEAFARAPPRAPGHRDVDDVDVADTWHDVDARHAAGGFVGSAPRAMLKGTPSAPSVSSGLAPGCVLAGPLRDVVGVPGKTLSCSDKIARWQMLGAQGALLSHLIPDPLAFDTVVVGRKFNPERVRAATCCRSRGFGHHLFRLGDGPKHCAALGASVKSEAATRAGAAIADRARADAGDGDESASWARGDARAGVHDGRTGGPVGGGGPIPAVASEALWRAFKALVSGPLRGRRDLVDVPVAAVEARTAAEAKRLAARYAAAKHAMLRGIAPEASPLARWREGR